MKLLIALAMVSSVSFAQELSVQDYLRSNFGMKTFYGTTPNSALDCSVSLRDQGSSIRISASVGGTNVAAAVIPYDSNYSIARNRFLTGQSFLGPRGQQHEQIFMSRRAADDLQYMVVEESILSGRETQRTTVECLVRL